MLWLALFSIVYPRFVLPRLRRCGPFQRQVQRRLDRWPAYAWFEGTPVARRICVLRA